MPNELFDRAAVGVYENQTIAAEAVSQLNKSEIVSIHISVIGRDTNVDDATTGVYSPSDSVLEGVKEKTVTEGTWMGGVFGLLIGFGSFLLPEVGVLAVAGPFAGLLGGMTVGAIGGEIAGQTVLSELASEHRRWLMAGNFLVIVNCTSADEPKVLSILTGLEALHIDSHPIRLKRAVGL